MSKTLFVGPLIHSVSINKLEILPRAALLVNHGTGRIEQLFKNYAAAAEEEKKESSTRVIHLTGNQFLLPGLIDTHTHAPQYVNSGIGYDEELLTWLQKYTFPAESKFESTEFARRVYEKCVRKHLINGTTTCVYFATIHRDGSLELARVCKELGQRALVGKVNMDQMAPEFYVEKNAQESLQHTEEFIRGVLQMNNSDNQEKSRPEDLVIPVITPRFVPTCTPELMRGLGELARKYDLPIQSHVSENMSEVRWIRELHPDQKSYTAVYDHYGLLTDRTLLAHGVLLTDEEIKLLRERGSTISHCPLSNFSLNSGVLNIRRLFENGVRVSLGTDVSGGYSPSMLNAMRNALITSVSNASQYRIDNKDVDGSVQKNMSQTPEQFEQNSKLVPEPLTVEELIYLATIAGAESVGLHKEVGNFEPGKQFDALIVDVDAQDGPIDTFLDDGYKPHEMYSNSSNGDEDSVHVEKYRLLLQRFLFLGDDRNISKIFVSGKQVKGGDN